MVIGGGTSILAQIGPHFGQVTLEAMSEGGQKGKLIRQLDRNRVHSKGHKSKYYCASFKPTPVGYPTIGLTFWYSKWK